MDTTTNDFMTVNGEKALYLQGNFMATKAWVLFLNNLPIKAQKKLLKQPVERTSELSNAVINSLNKCRDMYNMHEITDLNIAGITDDTNIKVKQFHNEEIGPVLLQFKYVDWMSKNIGNLCFETNAKNSPIVIYKKYRKKKVFIGFIMPVRS